MSRTTSFLLSLTTAAVAATTGNAYYVATTGSDSNPGTLASPFRTVQKCGDVAQPGETCLIRAGTYSTLRPARSGTSGNPITFKNYPNESPVLNYSYTAGIGPNPEVFVIDLSYRSGIVIDGLTLTGGSQGIMMYSGSNDNQILNCEVKGAWGTGITIWGNSNRNLVKNCKIHDNVQQNWPRGAIYSRGGTWGAGIIAASGTNQNIFESNYVYWNHGEGMTFGIGGANNTAQYNVIADNWSVNLYADGVLGTTVFNGNLVYLTNEAKNWPTIDPQGRNKSTALGIGLAVEPDSSFVSALSGLQITNNIVVNANGGIYAWPEEAGHTFSGWLIANNTLINNGTGLIIHNSGAGVDSINVRKNIITANTYAQLNVSPAPTNAYFGDNIYNGVNTFYRAGFALNYAGWLSASGEANSYFTSPLLLNETAIPPRFWSDPSLPPPSTIVPLATLVSPYAPASGSLAVAMGALP